MQSKLLWRAILFIGGSIVTGLALAFLIVAMRPELLRRQATASSADAAPSVPLAATPAPDPAAPIVGTSATPAPAPQRGPESYADAVALSSPAVVNISTARLVTERVSPPGFEQLFGGLQPLYRQRVQRSLGSGVIVDARGHIVTNHHVIADAQAIMVELSDGRGAQASVVGRDPDTDLALLKIDMRNLPVMPLGRSDRLRVGDVVLAIGSPLGLTQTVTQGIVSATDRKQLGVATFESFIQTDAAINVGNSGGALVNVRGELIGINTAKLGDNFGADGIGVAIPVDLMRGVMRDILEHGRVIRGSIGILPDDVSEAQARYFGLPGAGVYVINVIAASPAVQAGIRPGDRLDAVDGLKVSNAQQVLSQIAARKPGSRVKLTGDRRGQSFEVEVSVIEPRRAA